MRGIATALHSGVEYIQKHPQLLMTLLLMIVIPVAFLVSGQQFLTAARENQERLEKDRVGIIQDMLASFLNATDFNHERIQHELEYLASLNPDITKLRIAKREGSLIRVVAALDHESINTLLDDASAKTYRIGNASPNESFISPLAYEGVRYWQSFRLVQQESSDDYYIFMETSLAHIDALFASRIRTAYYWLIGLVVFILLLVVRHVRIIDYGYLYRETKKANEMKDLFTNMIAHELRAPLTAMRGYASMIREQKQFDESTRVHATRIEESASRLVLIVSDLLDVARIQSGKLSVANESVPVAEVITGVVEALSVSAKEKGVTITHEGVHTDVHVLGDEKRLFQAFTNVVSNAIKYTKQGSITIGLEERSDRVEVRIKDTGMGISAENQQKLFAPFFRAEGDAMAGITGTGLGMWITKQLIELMGGSISVESIKGVGTHVVVVLPIAK